MVRQCLQLTQVSFGCCQNKSVSGDSPSYSLIALCDNKLTSYFSQLQQGSATGAEAYNGMVDCFKKIVKNEGYLHLSSITLTISMLMA